MIVALLALFVALGGVSYGVATDSIGSRELADNAVRSRDIRDNDLRSTDIRTEPYHEVGARGEPAFSPGWSNTIPATESTAAFFKDPFGVVHLKGIVRRSGGDSTIFFLPAGYRPPKLACFANVKAEIPVVAGYTCVAPDGELRPATGGGNGRYLLDGITFRAGAG